MENYPIFNNEFFSNIQTKNDFIYYLNYTTEFVNNIQKSNSNSNSIEIPLSFYPIAKNIRMTASYMLQNILNDSSSHINNMSRNGEQDFWRNHKKMGDWYPWLWSRGRINDNYTNKEGWQYYFTSFITDNKENVISDSREESDISEPPEIIFPFFLYLSCLKYAFQFNENYQNMMLNYKNKMNWPTDSKILAVQIRRGETCTKDGSITDRHFFHLDKYIEKIDIMLQKNHFDYIYISTDSDEEIQMIQLLRPLWKLLSLPIDRTQFFRMKDGFIDLEEFCKLEPDRIPFIVDSGLADLYFISHCQGYISTISMSEFSRCGWFLQLATQGYLTPYINMNTEPLDMSKRDSLLLL